MFKMKKKDIFYIFMVCFCAIFFIATCLIVYETNLKYKNLSDFMQNIALDVSLNAEAIKSIDDNIDKLNEKDSLLKEKISIVSASISPQDQRWALIKKVRSVIRNTIDRRGYKDNLNIKGLTSAASAVVDFSDQYDVPMSLILGVMTRESAFNTRAVSHAGARGLMQLMPNTAQECANDVGKKYYNIYNIRDNIQLGVWYLWKMIDLFDNDIDLAIMAYNAGPTTVKKVLAGEFHNYPKETEDYLKYVKMFKEWYENLGI